MASDPVRIEVEVRSAYGRPLIYPMNDAAFLALRLTGRETFSLDHLKALRGLGLSVVEVNPSKLNLEKMK
jgi:hypothetical protein